MTKSLFFNRSIPLLLAALLLATIPGLFFIHLAVLAIFTNIFVVVCIIDFIKKTALRKPFGLVLGFMYLAEIISGMIMYVLFYANNGS